MHQSRCSLDWQVVPGVKTTMAQSSLWLWPTADFTIGYGTGYPAQPKINSQNGIIISTIVGLHLHGSSGNKLWSHKELNGLQKHPQLLQIGVILHPSININYNFCRGKPIVHYKMFFLLASFRDAQKPVFLRKMKNGTSGFWNIALHFSLTEQA